MDAWEVGCKTFVVRDVDVVGFFESCWCVVVDVGEFVKTFGGDVEMMSLEVDLFFWVDYCGG